MDGGGRLDQPLMRSGQSGAKRVGAPHDEPSRAHAPADQHRRRENRFVAFSTYRRLTGRWAARIAHFPLPRGAGVAGSILLIAGALAYGAVAGQHVPEVTNWVQNARDIAANSLGFRIAAISLTGEKEVSREEILTTAGVTGRASLLFLDADAARTRLLANPWIADAAVLKLYPNRLQITITERHAFALWQKDGRVSVIAADGTVLEPFVENRYLGLPLVVGAERRASGQGLSRHHRSLSRHPIGAARIDPGGGSALGPAAQQRHQCEVAGNRCRRRTRPPGRTRPRQEAPCRATSRWSICGCRIA